MKKILKIIASLIILIGIGLVGLFEFIGEMMCGNQVPKQYLSPDTSLKAVIFQRDCGATSGFSTQISILDSDGELDNESGNIFIIDGHPDKVAPFLNWKNDNELNIKYSLNGREFTAENHFGWFNPIKITYND